MKPCILWSIVPEGPVSRGKNTGLPLTHEGKFYTRTTSSYFFPSQRGKVTRPPCSPIFTYTSLLEESGGIGDDTYTVQKTMTLNRVRMNFCR